MSGGKTGNASGGADFDFLFAIPQAAISALVKTGANAVVNARTVVEMSRIIETEQKKQEQSRQRLKAETDQNLRLYEKNLLEQVNKLKETISHKGLSVPAVSGSAEKQLTDLLSFIRSASASSAAALPEVQVALTRLNNLEKNGQTFARICEAADQIILAGTSYAANAAQIKEKAVRLMEKKSADAEAFSRLYDSLLELLPISRVEHEKQKSLRAEYDRELARVRAIYSVLGISFFAAPYNEKDAQNQIFRLKSISAEKLAYLEEIRKNPALTMSPEDRKKAAEAVAAKICAVLTQRGHQLQSCLSSEHTVAAYYDYHDALLKAVVTDTGGISFEVVGSAGGKTSFTQREKETVLAGMQTFQKEFPEINKELEKKRLRFNLWNSYEPSMSYVTFEEVGAQTAQQSANQAAVIAMMNAANKYMYADWSGS